MVFWPLSPDYLRRSKLVFQELFHRIQDDLGLPAKNAMCNHLDTKDGRMYLRLELAALSKALSKHRDQRKEDLTNALTYRKYRQQLFKDSKTLEDELEFNEGLAEFTGVEISGINKEGNLYLINRLDSAASFYKTFVRSFG